MSERPSDAFLPSGAVPPPSSFFPPSKVPPFQVAPSFPAYTSPGSLRSPPDQKRPISPPTTRSASTDDNFAALVEDWRTYTSKLRVQSQGERAHMLADRERAEEVMAEERDLWETERGILKARIAELEAELDKRIAGSSVLSLPSFQREHPGGRVQLGMSNVTSPASTGTGSLDGTSISKTRVPQESGRNVDGSPFYAPAPRNPSRTFELTDVSAVRVDTVSAPRESPIRVTSKELTPLDFTVQRPPTAMSMPKATPETVVDSIDISRIQPELEGVSIRTSALSPKFTAKIFSPRSSSPAKLSPSTLPHDRNFNENQHPTIKDNSLSPNKSLKADVQVMLPPETQRLTMHAGHTPNHSISKFADLLGESGSATPTQANTGREPVHYPPADDIDYPPVETGDVELTGPLGFTNKADRDDAFIAQLVEKLDEVKNSESPSAISENSEYGICDDEAIAEQTVDAEEDVPPLRLKPSLNFGRPIGRI